MSGHRPTGPARAASPTEVDTTVVTINAGRDRHLLELAAGVGRCAPAPRELVVVGMGGARQPRTEVEHRAGAVPVRWIDVPNGDGGRLPLAAARNAGAQAAVSSNLIFLDVDCIPGADLVGAYTSALATAGVVSGPVRWLERFWDHDAAGSLPEAVLDVRSVPHPVRPVPEQVVDDGRHELLWTLACGIRRADLERIGGFDEGYVGYGAEDTDLGFRARAGGLPMRWLPTGTAYHQWHRVSDPPVEHLDAIVANARRFHTRWGTWPMEGWLSDFAALELVEWRPDGDRLDRTARPVGGVGSRVVSIPATHPYTRRVLPDDVVCDPDPTVPWWPHPALDPRWIAEHVEPGDVVHLHFGFEHRTTEEMEAWCGAVGRSGAALVVTVHDVDNPHCTPAQQADHGRRMAAVVAAADVVLTLTPSAASEVAQRWGRKAEIVPHPHVAAIDQAPRRGTSEGAVVGVDLKAVRAGSLDLEDVLRGIGRAAADAGARAVAWIEDGAPAASIDAARRAAGRHGVDLRVEPVPDDAGIVRRFAALDVALLPYRSGTHSGLLELCRDVGTRAVVPDHGSYGDQWEEAVTFPAEPHREVDAADLTAAVVHALQRGPVAPEPRGWRADQLATIRRRHREAYAAARARAMASRAATVTTAAGTGT